MFAVLLSIAPRATFSATFVLGLPLYLLIPSWFFKYAYILFDQVSRGFDEPPVLDIAMVNPVDEQRPAGQVLILGLLLGAVYCAYLYLGRPAAIALCLFCLVFLPASVAVLGLEGNILTAANPVAWLRMARGLGPLYLLVLALIAAETCLIVALVGLGLWEVAAVALVMFGILSVFSVLAGAIYERRDELGIDTWISPERTAERDRRESLRQDENLVTEAYGLLRAREHVKSWNLLQGWLEDHGHNAQAYGWLCDRVSSWEDSRYITRLTEEYVERLLAEQRAGAALDLVAARLKLDPSFRPRSAAATLAIAQLAARGGGQPKLAKTLVSDFASRFAGDPRVAVAASLAQFLQA